jgi:hypothetical protein
LFVWAAVMKFSRAQWLLLQWLASCIHSFVRASSNAAAVADFIFFWCSFSPRVIAAQTPGAVWAEVWIHHFQWKCDYLEIVLDISQAVRI